MIDELKCFLEDELGLEPVGAWVMQVNTPDGWRSVRPSGDDAPYRYETREEAERALRTFYPDSCRFDPDTVRVHREP